MIHKFARRAAPLAALALGVALSGCALAVADWEEVEGVPLAELDMSGDPPTSVTLAGPDKVVITNGETLEITLEGNAEAGEALRFNRDGDELTIARDSKVYDGSGTAIVRLTMPAASHLAIAGSGSIEADTMASKASAEIAGSGGIKVAQLEAEQLDVDIAGSGSVTAAGTTERLTVDIAGSGNVRLGELSAGEVEVGIAGSGNVDLASNGTVDAEIAGSGNIVVTGSAVCKVESAGSGSLTCRPSASSAEATKEDEEAAAE